MIICIVGAGWAGCHLAVALALQGHTVTLVEKNAEILSAVSGKFGIRLHAGPHYPRSASTRSDAQTSFQLFIAQYPELVVEHSHSIYALGNLDADMKPSKVDQSSFDKVCREFNFKKQINCEDFGFQNIILAHDIEEPSIRLGQTLRDYFTNKIQQLKICVKNNTITTNIISHTRNAELILNNGERLTCDYVINATGFTSLLPPKPLIPAGIEVVYQCCLALSYKDTKPISDKPISFIVMDGWFPCLMPYVDNKEFENNYILTHAKYTTAGSCESYIDAKKLWLFAILRGLVKMPQRQVRSGLAPAYQ